MRDAAAYVCWAFARAYTAADLVETINKLAPALLVTACYDREVVTQPLSSSTDCDITCASLLLCVCRADSLCNDQNVCACQKEVQQAILRSVACSYFCELKPS